MSPTCPRNMANFGPVAAEIDLPVWGTPPNLNGFRVLAALLHSTLVVGVSQTAALNRRHHLCSAASPSRWALAHILVINIQRVFLKAILHWCWKVINAWWMHIRTEFKLRVLLCCIAVNIASKLTVFNWQSLLWNNCLWYSHICAEKGC